MQHRRTDSELQLVVTGTRRDGRRRYDVRSKRSLAKACLQPGVSLAGMALKHGVNANLLRKWVVDYQLAPDVPDEALTGAFVPVKLGSSVHAMQDIAAATQPTAAISTMTALKPPPLRLRAHMPNGVMVEFDFDSGDSSLITTVIDTLGRCNVSTER